MDALFIGRKKSAGRSVRNPLFGTLLFDNDSVVEEFVQQHPSSSRANEVCDVKTYSTQSISNTGQDDTNEN